MAFVLATGKILDYPLALSSLMFQSSLEKYRPQINFKYNEIDATTVPSDNKEKDEQEPVTVLDNSSRNKDQVSNTLFNEKLPRMARELHRRGNEMLNSHGRWVKRINTNDDNADNEWIWIQNETTCSAWTSTLPLSVPLSESDTEQELTTTNFPNRHFSCENDVFPQSCFFRFRFHRCRA